MEKTRTVPSGVLLATIVGMIVIWQSSYPAATSEEKVAATGVLVSSVIDAGQYSTVQAAIDALPTEGGLVQLPPGKIYLDEPLEITTEDTRIQGAGPATHIVNRSRDGQPAIILRHPKRDVAEQTENRNQMNWRLQITDLRISGNPQSGDGLLAIGICEIYLHNLFIDHNGGHGIKLADCYENPRITDCNITYNGKAGLRMISSSHNPVISSCHFEENRDGVVATHIYNICMTGNNFDDQTRHGIVVEDCWGGVFTGNMVEQCSGTGIIIDGDSYGMALTANIIGQNYEGGIHLKDGWGCAVSANTFSITHERALVIGSESGRTTVTGNNFSNTWIGGKNYRDEPASGIHLEGTTDVSITGNVFSGLCEKAIQQTGQCERIIVSSNLTTDLRQAPGLDTAGIKELVRGLNLEN